MSTSGGTSGGANNAAGGNPASSASSSGAAGGSSGGSASTASAKTPPVSTTERVTKSKKIVYFSSIYQGYRSYLYMSKHVNYEIQYKRRILKVIRRKCNSNISYNTKVNVPVHVGIELVYTQYICCHIYKSMQKFRHIYIQQL